MSGTSLDGLDIAYAEFWKDKPGWHFRLGNYCTIAYSADWQQRLGSLPQANALSLAATHHAFGVYCGKALKKFIDKHQLNCDIVGSHGHTVFHQPQEGFSTQIGDGAAIAAHSGQRIACDFRSSDLAKNGQGAPLVPIGDALLFGEYAACVNMGGFANISYTEGTNRIAFDICPANIVLNSWAQQLGKNFDEGGYLAQSGSVMERLLAQLNDLPYYKTTAPKSLGKEWVDSHITPILHSYNAAPKDILRTYSEHIAMQIAAALPSISTTAGKILMSGGGAFNQFLIARIQSHCPHRIVVADKAIVEMKEALIFAFLGLLRYLEQPNILSSVTGAYSDSISGAIYLP